MTQQVLKIGVVGFSANAFDQTLAKQLLASIFTRIKTKHTHKHIQIVSGYTNTGVPLIAYQLAQDFGFQTVGFSAKQALQVKSGLYPVDEVIIVGERFGDESESFVRYIDGLIRIGGGSQSRREVELFKTLKTGLPIASILIEQEVNWYGKMPRIYLPNIQGLELVENFLSIPAQKTLIRAIDQEKWSTVLRRRVQHYGYEYDYRKRAINESMRVQALPDWATAFAQQLMKANIITYAPDQMIVNEYLPGQGIADHIDCEPCFDDTIISLSLGSDILMNLTPKGGGSRTTIHLKTGSVLVLRGAARFDWMHGITARKSDVLYGKRTPRSRRLSMTFRKVILTK